MSLRFILGAKESDHHFLFDWVSNTASTQTDQVMEDQGVVHRFRYLNGAPLNDTCFTTEVTPGVLGNQAQRQGTAFFLGDGHSDQ